MKIEIVIRSQVIDVEVSAFFECFLLSLGLYRITERNDIIKVHDFFFTLPFGAGGNTKRWN